MANSKDNLNKYGKAFIGFDETSGNTIDSIGGYTGTIYNTPTRVTGWDGKGYAMDFNGTNQYVQYNSKVIPIGAKSIRLKLKITGGYPANGVSQNIINTLGEPNQKGFIIELFGDNFGIASANGDSTSWTNVTHSFIVQVPRTTLNLADNMWHDILFTWDGTLNPNSVKLFIDDMTNPIALSQAKNLETSYVNNLTLGKWAGAGNYSFFNGQLDQIEIYDSVISPIPDKYLVQHNSQHKYHNGTSWQTTTATEENFIKYGMNNLDHITEAQWNELSGNKSMIMWSDFEDKQFASVVLNKETFKAQDLLGDTAQVIYYTDSDTSQVSFETGVEPYSVYDYIGELPEVLVYTETTDDIVVSTTTEPFDIYDEFGDSVEVLYYTDDEDVNEADLILEANWSPIDELEGDFEVVTWTDEAPETAQRVLEMTAIPKPQFIKLVNPKRVYGALDDVIVNDISQSYRDEARYFIAGETPDKWYVWDKKLEKFVVSDASTEQAISANGMKHTDLNNITDAQWRTWKEKYLNIGVFLKDNPRDTIVSVVESVSYEDYLPRDTTTISDTSLYILNTTAKIDISFDANILKGILSDDDLTRVQYRVLLNNGYYYPTDGSFTKLGESPQNIELVIGSKDIRIDDWNTLKIEFQDFFGTTDYWQASFIGSYSGLMFKDVYGQYFSSEIGEVLQYLDFGVIIAGQTTIEHEVILKNQYGYDVKNIHLYANTSNFPTGMTCEFSTSSSPFDPQPDLRLGSVLQNNEEMSFFIRLKSELGATPDANGSFDIIVRADKA
ncbi:LamG-like jellyroll fold domain-containing protein [Lysinibacillus parviboronicapiens]|uniref:LamG-like jellyroll fold domain-containing protein n=1 Tax=Lysinibacillus parviboronicapiens TaxID=436516 RepID=UPI000D3BFBBF|nr:LamG-like jellyroll fold domain-containing protein [Lysinibacillus parviboronicapiens]